MRSSLLGYFLITIALARLGANAADKLNVGVIVSATGPVSSLGIPERNTVPLLPKSMSGLDVNYIIRDDTMDPTVAVREMRELILDGKVDIVIGSTATTSSLAMVEVAGETKTPMISLAASATIVEPVTGPRRWVFKTPQNDALMASALAEYMASHGVKRLGFITLNDAYGESWFHEISKSAKEKGIEIVSSQRFARSDTSVTAQSLKLISSNPDAILIAAFGTLAALPQKSLFENDYQGKYYQTYGITVNEFLKLAGKEANGDIVAAAPVVVAAQLPDSNPIKPIATAYIDAYDKVYGVGSASSFGSYVWDAARLIEAALPSALAKANPGTPEFRAALRESLENLKNVVTSNGVTNMSADDHVGQDSRARVMITIENGKWLLLQ